MPDTLLSTLEKAVPREISGARTAARFDFQVHYSILKLIELLESGAPFRLLFDVYDDLVVLDAVDDPNKIKTYQIKSKDPGYWTCAELCSKKGKVFPKTIVGRMFLHHENFGQALAETALVSNAPYIVALSGGGNSAAEDLSIAGTSLHYEELAKISGTIKQDCGGADASPWLPKLTLIRTPLSVNGQDVFVVGRLQQYLDAVSVGGSGKTSALYDTIYSAISARTRTPFQASEGFSGALRKSLSRTEVDDLLAAAIARKPGILESWPLIAAELEAAGMSSAERLRLRSECFRYVAMRSTGDALALKFSDAAKAWMEQNSPDVDACQSILELSELLLFGHSGAYVATDRQKRAAAIVEAYEGIDG